MLKASPKPARMLRQAAFVFVFINAAGLFILATADAQSDAYYYRAFSLALLWASVSIVIGTYLSIRRAWMQEPPSDFRDGILPAAIVFAIGWLIWTLAHF